MRGTRGRPEPRIAIIGAGAGGIAVAVRLSQAGFADFTVFEKSDGLGGVWFDNTYPGCEVDVHSHLYSFSFMAYDWKRTHATQSELREYLEDTVDRFQLREHFRFGTRVAEAIWDVHSKSYTVHFANGTSRSFDMVVSCVGFLNNPRFPDGLDPEVYKGTVFHTSRWPRGENLVGKHVAVIGTGSTAAQIVPAIASEVASLHVFQREPGWIIPKGDRDFSTAERSRYMQSRWVQRSKRYGQFRKMSRLTKHLTRQGSRRYAQLRESALELIEASIDDEQTKAAVRPQYPLGCKRAVISSTFYSALNRANVNLVPYAVDKLTERGVVADGEEYNFDAIIFATGFQAQNYLAGLRVVGVSGRELHTTWAGSPMAFLGVTVAHFPNFFMIYGPNTNGGGPATYQIERGAELVARLARCVRRGAAVIETRELALKWYIKWIDMLAARNLSVQHECHNYYHSPNGRNVTQWPSRPLVYHIVTLVFPIFGLRFRRR
jgi:cation diffusion facilitator CzcD-associated flavoprotein CzcO